MATPVLMLTGASGFIGRRLLLGLNEPWRVVPAYRNPEGMNGIGFDLANPKSLAPAFDALLPAAVVHAGAIANPDVCEREPELARRVNIDAVKVLARLCADAKARFIHFSTDFVFDGETGWYREDHVTRPLSAYG